MLKAIAGHILSTSILVYWVYASCCTVRQYIHWSIRKTICADGIERSDHDNIQFGIATKQRKLYPARPYNLYLLATHITIFIYDLPQMPFAECLTVWTIKPKTATYYYTKWEQFILIFHLCAIQSVIWVSQNDKISYLLCIWCLHLEYCDIKDSLES